MNYLPYRRTKRGINLYTILVNVNLAYDDIFRAKFAISGKRGVTSILSKDFKIFIYSRTSMARTLMARLPRLFRTRS